jgi:GNAT superfamily N-acetyltransferase
MANVQIITAGPSDVATLARLYNEIFRPPQTEEFFKRRFLGRYNLTLLLATLDGRPVGFIAGFELKPATYYSWLCGVLPDFRRLGVASQLMEAMEAWAAEHAYAHVRMECHNRHREVLKLAIDLEYDIVGMRWDTERADNLVIFEKTLHD